ncbi:MAG: hypothetical protein WCJ13_09810 [Coriobacteriia bacterium]
MATKADFSEAQWQTLVFSVQGAMAFVAFSNGAHFWESMKEATETAKFITQQAKSSTSTLVRDLAMGDGLKRDKKLTADSAALETEVVGVLAEASKIVADTAPEELAAYKAFILGVADAAAEASGAVDSSEQAAIDKIKAALV